MIKHIKEADALAGRIAELLESRQAGEAFALLAPILSERTSFHLLDRIGARIGAGPIPQTNAFLETVAQDQPMGGWPLIGSALAAQLPRDLEGALERCRTFILSAGVWYAADTLAERVPGAALVTDFQRTLAILERWRSDPNRWVRKSAGVAVHLWTKRSRGEARHLTRVKRLLAFLAPMVSEKEPDAVKGIGWALKTLGRYYPDAVTPWLVREVVSRRRCRPLMLRKALTYLPAKGRKRILKAAER
jgi:3-methyladenine DNA glycosylase AlkD